MPEVFKWMKAIKQPGNNISTAYLFYNVVTLVKFQFKLEFPPGFRSQYTDTGTDISKD
jgi:hypothetical protein